MFLGLSTVFKVAIVLGLALTAFFIATIVVAVQKSDLEDEVAYLKIQLEALKTTTPAPTLPTYGTTTPTTPTTTAPPKIHYRLPGDVIPISYELLLSPDLANGTFIGGEIITIEVITDTNEIILHSNGLEITYVNVFNDVRRTTKAVTEYKLDRTREFLIITLNERLVKGRKYGLGIEFKGESRNKIVGLYSSSYTNSDGEVKWIATSKFEPTYARQAFPCFDEPAMKAKFKITVTYPKTGGYHALSNMNLEKIEEFDDDLNSAVFAESVPMSTYLACFIVSDFVEKEMTVETGIIGENFKMRVFATPDQVDKVTFALETGVKITEFYIQYFGIEYPLPKLDMAAIPDFVSGAMEHWGLVTFRETSLLYHPDVSSSINKQRIGSVVSHELAHMWFGNLVTMKWWNDLWLNEGFASYIQYKGLNHAHSTWGLIDQFLIADLHGVLNFDSTLASHPIVQSVESPDQITELFDTITYAKGASIIRMLEDFVGTIKFQEAVKNYLDKFKYSNAVTEDLLTEIANLVTDIEVKHILQTWTNQMGFPVVSVVKVSPTEYKLKQTRFLSNPTDENQEQNDSPFNYRWFIPIRYITSNQQGDAHLVWFNNTDSEITVTLSEPAEWVKFNRDQIGYYRVNYDPAIWQQFGAVLKADVNSMSIADRAHLLNDVYSLADATKLSYDIAFDFMAYLTAEKDYVPWSVAASKLVSLKTNLYHVDYYQKFLAFGQNLLKDIYTQVGWTPNDDHINNRLRITILESACALQYQPCLDEATKQFNTWLENPTVRPNPDIRTVVYTYGIASIKDAVTWDKVWELFKAETDASEKVKLMSALAAIEVPSILRKYVDLAWDTDNVRSQDYFTCIEYIAANRAGESIVWDYVRENWHNLVSRFGLNERYLGRMIPSITGRFSSHIKLQEVQYFFEMNPEAGAGASSRRQAIENIRNKIQWLEGNKEVIGEWLAKQT